MEHSSQTAHEVSAPSQPSLSGGQRSGAAGAAALGDEALSAELSALEYALIVAMNGFTDWAAHCAEAAGAKGLSAIDTLVLHAIQARAKDRKLADICLVMNISDSHIVAYCLKKLVDYGYAEARLSGRDKTYRPSADGEALCAAYLAMRRQSLVASLAAEAADPASLAQAAANLKRLARHYAEASRTAVVLSNRG